MKQPKPLQLGDLLSLEGLEKPQNDVSAALGQKGGNLLYREMGGLADRFEGKENVELAEVKGLVDAIRENVEGMKVVYFGDEMPWEEYMAIENLAENTRVCREIIKDDKAFGVGCMTHIPMGIAVILGQIMKYGDLQFSSLKNLSPKTARELAKRRAGLHFSALSEISVELATELAGLQGALHLDGLKELSVDVAAALAKHRGSHLYLDGLADMLPEVAEELAKCTGNLSFNGIKEMKTEVARALSTHKGGLTLGGLETLSPQAAAELAKTGNALQLWKLKKMDKETAGELGNFRGYLGLANLEDMDEEIAKGLANQQGVLYLIGLKEFKPGVAAALGKHRGGGMCFHSVSKITEEDALGLAQHVDGIRLAGVMDISDQAAKILGESGLGMSRMSEMMEEKVNKYRVKKEE